MPPRVAGHPPDGGEVDREAPLDGLPRLVGRHVRRARHLQPHHRRAHPLLRHEDQGDRDHRSRPGIAHVDPARAPRRGQLVVIPVALPYDLTVHHGQPEPPAKHAACPRGGHGACVEAPGDAERPSAGRRGRLVEREDTALHPRRPHGPG